MEALPSVWCIVGSAEIPTVLFSPQWVFAQNPVEQQWTELPYKLRGNKISSWGRNSPLCAPKEKLPYAQKINKESSGVRKPPRFRQADSSAPAQAFAQRPPSFAVCSFHTRKHSTCKVANFFFGTFFFLGKKKVGTVPLFQSEEQTPRLQTKKSSYFLNRKRWNPLEK